MTEEDETELGVASSEGHSLRRDDRSQTSGGVRSDVMPMSEFRSRCLSESSVFSINYLGSVIDIDEVLVEECQLFPNGSEREIHAFVINLAVDVTHVRGLLRLLKEFTTNKMHFIR